MRTLNEEAGSSFRSNKNRTKKFSVSAHFCFFFNQKSFLLFSQQLKKVNRLNDCGDFIVFYFYQQIAVNLNYVALHCASHAGNCFAKVIQYALEMAITPWNFIQLVFHSAMDLNTRAYTPINPATSQRAQSKPKHGQIGSGQLFARCCPQSQHCMAELIAMKRCRMFDVKKKKNIIMKISQKIFL